MTAYRLYTVTCEVKYPAWNEREPFTWNLTAKTASEAAKDARRQWKDNGNFSPIIVRSTKLAAENEEPTMFW